MLWVPQAGSWLWSKCTKHGGSESLAAVLAREEGWTPSAAALAARYCVPKVAHAARPGAQGLGGQSHKLALVLEAGVFAEVPGGPVLLRAWL